MKGVNRFENKSKKSFEGDCQFTADRMPDYYRLSDGSRSNDTNRNGNSTDNDGETLKGR